MAKIWRNFIGESLESNNLRYSLVKVYVLPEPADALYILKLETSKKFFLQITDYQPELNTELQEYIS